HPVRCLAGPVARRAGGTSGRTGRMGWIQPGLAPRFHGMKVLVETSAIYTSRAGVARYVQGLLHGLKQVEPANVEELGWPVENLDYAQPMRAVKTLAREWGWAKWIAPSRVRRADVLHHTALPMIPFVQPTRHVVTLHDLALVRHPERFRSWQRNAGLRRLRRV